MYSISNQEIYTRNTSIRIGLLSSYRALILMLKKKKKCTGICETLLPKMAMGFPLLQ